MDATTNYIYGDMTVTGAYWMDQHMVVASSGRFNAPEIVLTGTRVLENNGVIDVSDIKICENCRLEIYNRGIFNANFTLDNNASVVQVVSSDADMSKIDFNVDYDLWVRNADKIKMSDVLSFGDAANEILVRDSFIVWDVRDVNIGNLKLTGDIKLELDDVESLVGYSMPVDIDANARVQIMSDGRLNPMFTLVPYMQNSKMYAQIARETDYTRFLDNNIGAFINSLRDNGDAGGVLGALDNAMSINEIHKIMADSMRIAPINLMRGVSVLNMLDMNNYVDGMRGGAMLFAGEDVYSYGAALNADFSFGGIDFGVRGYINSLSETDDYDRFSGTLIGANLHASYDIDDVFVRGMLGANITYFNVAGVFDGAKSVDNPIGYSVYGGLDVGHKFNLGDGVYVAPYVGGIMNVIELLHQDESEYYGRIGTDVGYSCDVLGIKYNYSVRANIDSNTNVFIGGRIGFVTDVDMIGGHADVGYIDNEAGRGYKIAAGIDFKF